MESIGEKLKTAREEKGYSTDQVARDTNIARRFILAMEQEDFSAFPGDTYLLGFLRNYSDYLGLDSERLVNLYRNMQIQEQPVPMEELLQGKKTSALPSACMTWNCPSRRCSGRWGVWSLPLAK
ncbi:MAG: helix-turn-helix domain-containing protein [Spirochaetia bacterium]|nr:helix-turn-helix domain-containing protein [Spirochaetia bacterium]